MKQSVDSFPRCFFFVLLKMVNKNLATKITIAFYRCIKFKSSRVGAARTIASAVQPQA